MTLRITGVLDFAHHPELKTRKNSILESGSVSVLREREEDTYSAESLITDRLALSKGPNRVGLLLPSPEDGNRSSFRIVVISSF
jgi:hypothetical protein